VRHLGTNPTLPRHRMEAAGSKRELIVAGKKYLNEQAATLLGFARTTTDPQVAARLLDKAADLSARSNAAPDASPRAPDVEQPQR
jgi:hypothetical protein